MANAAVDSDPPTQAPAVFVLLSGLNRTHGFRAPIPVHVPLGHNVFKYVGDLPPSQGTGVFIPQVHETFHGGTEDGNFHGNTRRGGGANPRVDGHANVTFHGGTEDGNFHGNTRRGGGANPCVDGHVNVTFHGGTEDGNFHGNTRRGGGANPRVDGHATHFDCEIDEGEGARLIGVELYNHINFNT